MAAKSERPPGRLTPCSPATTITPTAVLTAKPPITNAASGGPGRGRDSSAPSAAMLVLGRTAAASARMIASTLMARSIPAAAAAGRRGSATV